MAACDIYVQTSRYEGFGLTIAEAKVLHKPIVSTKYPVVYDQIKEGYNGLLAEMNAPSIAENILRLANNPDLQKTFTLNLQKEHNTTMEKESAKVISLINS
jgi:glycosyltransferase involved in cell wall biosynthesis